MRAARLITLAVAPFVVALAFAADPLRADPRYGNVIQDVVAGQNHENGDARWTSVVLSSVSNVCGFTGAERKAALGNKASAEPRANSLDCMATSVWIDNRSGRPIKCRAGITLDHPDDSGRKKIVDSGVVPSDSMQIVATAFVEEARVPGTYATEYEIASAKDMPPQADCGGKMVSIPDPDAFYPPEAKQAEVQGVVVLQYRIDGAAGRLRDILVHASSGSRALDLAALKWGKWVRATSVSDCGDRIYRLKVKFLITEEPDEPKANDGK